MNLLASLRYLIALEAHQHFGRAAKSCQVTQPALSTAIRSLEREFKVVIVKRGRNYAGLTPEGELVLGTAQRMLHEHNILQQALDSKAGLPTGPLRIAAVPMAMPILGRFAGALQALHPGIVPSVLSLSSPELEASLENLSIDLALGYTERMVLQTTQLVGWPQYDEHYYLLRRAAQPHPESLQIGAPMRWRDAARLPLALLMLETHNRTITDSAFVTAGAPVKPAIETNSILTLALSVLTGTVCSVMPGALVAAVRGYRELEALPLVEPDIRTPIGFMTQAGVRPSRALDAAVALAQEPQWLELAALNSGALVS